MDTWKLAIGKAMQPNILRVLYVLLAILAIALAGGAPDGFGPF